MELSGDDRRHTESDLRQDQSRIDHQDPDQCKQFESACILNGLATKGQICLWRMLYLQDVEDGSFGLRLDFKGAEPEAPNGPD
jgi:hypothetical protein